ncbi:MAG: class I SAM-dependent methyltransferase [Bacteroidota bacterium]
MTIRQIAWSIYGHFAWDRNRNTKMADKIFNIILTAIGTGNNNETVLDAGCGTGLYASRLSDKGVSVTGVDYAPAMIRIARKKCANEKVSYKLADLSKTLPYYNDYFNHAISISSLQAVPDPVFSLKELSRVVKKNGTIVLVHFGKPDTHKESIKKHVQKQLVNIKKPTFIGKLLFYLKSIFERSGFSTYWTTDDLKLIVEHSQLTIKRIKKIEKILIVEIKNVL